MFLKNKPICALSDEQLIQKIVAGNRLAFTEIYKRYSNRLLYYFYRMLGNSNDKAQDFLQDIFVKLIDKAHIYDPKRKFSTWIFSIAYNMCKNEYRRLSVRVNTPAENCSDILTCEPVGFDEQETPDIENFNTELFRELELLDEIHKSVFLLHYREGFSLKEIGLTLDISEGTVKSRLFYTRKRLAEKLSKYQQHLNNI